MTDENRNPENEQPEEEQAEEYVGKDGKQYEKEWSFSFDNLGRKIKDAVSSVTTPYEANHDTFKEAIEGAESAEINLRPAVSELVIHPLPADDDTLFKAEVTYLGELDFDVKGTTHKVVTLRQKNDAEQLRSFNTSEPLAWRVWVSPRLPLTLKLTAGVNQVRGDFRGLDLLNLSYDGGVSKTEITLPERAGGTSATIRSGVGPVTLTVAPNTTTDITVKGGVGKTTLYVPEDSPLKITGAVGMGGIHVPDHVESVSGGGRFIAQQGVWQTEDFENAESPITVDFNGGVGGLEVRKSS